MPPTYVEDLVAANEQAEARARIFVQQTRPTIPGPWEWFQTDAEGNPIDWIINNGDMP